MSTEGLLDGGPSPYPRLSVHSHAVAAGLLGDIEADSEDDNHSSSSNSSTRANSEIDVEVHRQADDATPTGDMSSEWSL